MSTVSTVTTSMMTADLLLAYSAYAIGTASPGPSNLAVMATAMHAGRRPAFVFALGVVSGSTVWGLLAAFGLSAVMAEYSQALVAIKILGGGYLLWLALKSARSALEGRALPAVHETDRSPSMAGLFLRGAAMHLTNPKTIFVWLSIVALAFPPEAGWRHALWVVAGCIPVGLAVFCGYALLFSTPLARRIHTRIGRWFDGALAALFGYAGIRMLTSKL